jgi:hypothetical protein
LSFVVYKTIVNIYCGKDKEWISSPLNCNAARLQHKPNTPLAVPSTLLALSPPPADLDFAAVGDCCSGRWFARRRGSSTTIGGDVGPVA